MTHEQGEKLSMTWCFLVRYVFCGRGLLRLIPTQLRSEGVLRVCFALHEMHFAKSADAGQHGRGRGERERKEWGRFLFHGISRAKWSPGGLAKLEIPPFLFAT